jgi:uncharacterized protein
MPVLQISSDSIGSAAGRPERYFTLDLIRGIAVMGILAMNIVGFAMPREAYDNPLAYGSGSEADIWSWLAAFVLFDGKMRGLFSLLFGASMLLVIERADAAGEPSARIHFLRMAWLLVFGLVHFYLVWWGDILSLYAPLGMIAWCFVYRPPGDLFRIGVALVLLQAVAYLLGTPYLGSSMTSADEMLLFRGGFGDIAAYRLDEELFDPLASLLFFGFETLGYMLLGMAALKTGFLAGAWSGRNYRRIAAIGLVVTLPAYALLGWLRMQGRFEDDLTEALSFPTTALLRPVTVVALAALIILLGSRAGPLARRIAAAGRAAFTNYLGTSILMTALFYGWGLGWFGNFNRVELWPVVLAVWLLMVAWSEPWLDRFQYGPFEWLWRSLARGRIEPMAKRA